MNNKNCINCTFFDKLPIQKREDNTLGVCKANPPSIPYPDYTENEKKLGVWPLVLGDWWCGIFQTKEKEFEGEQK